MDGSSFYLGRSGNDTSASGNAWTDTSNHNQSYSDEIKKTPTNPKRQAKNVFLNPENRRYNVDPIKLEKSSKSGSRNPNLEMLSKNLHVLVKVKPLFAEEQEEEERKQKTLQKTLHKTTSTIMKQKLNDLFKDLDPILEVSNNTVVCYKGVSVTQQIQLQDQSNSRDYIMSNPIASPNNSRYNRDRVLEYDHVYNRDDGDIEKLYTTWILPYMDNTEIENLNIFTYGSTGCGKTYTIQNILNYLLGDIFSFEGITTHCSYMEIYNDKVRDLLTGDDNVNDLFIRENPQGFQCIDGLSVHPATTLEHLKEIVQYGHDQRFTEETNLNKRSSRSHSILTVKVQSDRLNKNFTIVDLAGSERAAKAQNKGIRLKEGAMINKSLLALANCINSLTSEDNNKHVPFRDSKLTRLLKHVLTADETTRTVMIACVSGILRNKDETLNTLMYAKRCMGINNEFQHLNFSSNTTANDSVTAPTISTLTRVRSISIRNNSSRVLSKSSVSASMANNKVTKNRSASVNVFNSRNISKQPPQLFKRRLSVDDTHKNNHDSCQKEIQMWKDKFLNITNELNSFTNAGNINAENEQTFFSFLKTEFINSKVMLLLERRSWQLVKHSLSNLLTIYNKDEDIMMRNFILSKISECNEKLYQVQKLVGNSTSLFRELEALTLNKGIVLGQLDILSKIVENEILNDFNMAEETYFLEYYNTVFNFVDNLELILQNENNLKQYLHHKFAQVYEFVSLMKNKKIHEFTMKEFTLNEETPGKLNQGDVSVIKNDMFEKENKEMSISSDGSRPLASSGGPLYVQTSIEDENQLVELSTLSNEGESENMAQQIVIDSKFDMNDGLANMRNGKRRLHISNDNGQASLGISQRIHSSILTQETGYESEGQNKSESSNLGKERNDAGVNTNSDKTEEASLLSTGGKKHLRKKGIISLITEDVSME